MDIDDKELFDSAMTDEPVSDVADPPATEAPAQQEERPRDEHGRFAPKQAPEPEPAGTSPAPQAATQPQEAREDGHVPPWRLREIREERDAINQRYLEAQRQLEMLQRQQPKPEPKPSPDLFENPTGAIEYGVQQYVDPRIQRLEEQIAEEREARRLDYEETSRERVTKEFGREKVLEAYQWLGQMMQSDPSAKQFYETRIHNPSARRPFEELMTAYQAFQRNSNPDNWADKRIEERAASDPEYRAALLQRLTGQPQQQNRQVSNGQPQGSTIRMPPSLRNTPSALGNGADDDNDTSDAALFRHALR